MIPPRTFSRKFWKLSGQAKETLAVELVFGIVIGRWIGQLKLFKRNITKDVFLIIFQYFHNSSFPTSSQCIMMMNNSALTLLIVFNILLLVFLPSIMFCFNSFVIVWTGGCLFETEHPRSRGWEILDVDEQEVEGLENWAIFMDSIWSYGYHPL